MSELIPSLDVLRTIAPGVESAEPLADGGVELKICLTTKPDPTSFVHRISGKALARMAGTPDLIDHVYQVIDAAWAAAGDRAQAPDLVRAARKQVEDRVKATRGRPLIDVLFKDEPPIDDVLKGLPPDWEPEHALPSAVEPPEPERFAEDDSAFQARLWRRMRGKS